MRQKLKIGVKILRNSKFLSAFWGPFALF